MIAAGILPITWIDGRLFFLLGQDMSLTWSDFAGKREKSDKDLVHTAVREFFEESYGVLCDPKIMRTRIQHASIRLHGRTQNNHLYVCYLTEIPFLPFLRDSFAHHLSFMRQRNVHRSHMEKLDIMYVSYDELFDERLIKRNVFQETIRSHRDLLRQLAQGGPDLFRTLSIETSAREPESSLDLWTQTNLTIAK